MTTIYFDFETGGVLPSHPSIQLAAIAVDDKTGNELAAFESKIHFEPLDCDIEALEKNTWGKESVKWEGAPMPEVVAKKFAGFIKPFQCVPMVSKKSGKPYTVAKGAGYNAVSFDFPRLQQLFSGAFLPMGYQIRDVMQRVLFYFDENGNPPEDMKLTTVCKHFGIEIDGAHDALADVRMTAALYRKIKNAPHR